jgi:hypothetical protein
MAGHAVFEVAALGTDAAGEADVVELATAIAASAG